YWHIFDAVHAPKVHLPRTRRPSPDHIRQGIEDSREVARRLVARRKALLIPYYTPLIPSRRRLECASNQVNNKLANVAICLFEGEERQPPWGFGSLSLEKGSLRTTLLIFATSRTRLLFDAHDQDGHIVVAAALVGDSDELVSGFLRGKRPNDPPDLGLQNLGHSVGTQDERIPRSRGPNAEY